MRALVAFGGILVLAVLFTAALLIAVAVVVGMAWVLVSAASM